MSDLIRKILERNLLLFENRQAYLVIMASRLVALFAIMVIVKVCLAWNGSLPPFDTFYVISVLLALFAVGLSCAFYMGANRAARDSQSQLVRFLTDMRSEQRSHFSQLHHEIKEQRTQASPSFPEPDETEQAPDAIKPEALDDVQKQILNTLWTKQVNRWPNLSEGAWSFRINANAGSFFKFTKAKSKLILQGLITETNEGHIILTPPGFEYCRDHYEEIKSTDQWWPEETINEEKLKVAFATRQCNQLGHSVSSQ